MIGVVIVTHLRVAEELKAAAELMVGAQPQLCSVSLFPNQSSKEMHKAIESAIRKVDSGDGVLILTDMFGGSPSNLSLSFMDEDRVEIITGVSLPMLIRLISLREKSNIIQLKEIIVKYARENILLPSEMLAHRVS